MTFKIGFYRLRSGHTVFSIKIYTVDLLWMLRIPAKVLIHAW